MFAGTGNTGNNKVFQIFEKLLWLSVYFSVFSNFNLLPLNLELRTHFIWVSGDQPLLSGNLIQISQF